MSRALVESVVKDCSSGSPPPQRLRLLGARVALDAHTALGAEVVIEDGHIQALTPVSARSPENVEAADSTLTVDLSRYLLLPGLINAHDHLEFNLFPRLGQGHYPSCESWARDIYHPDRSPVREHLAVPKAVRLWWGGIKNLLAGVTTVCHHNAFDASVFAEDFPVRVVSRYGWAHSIALEKDIPGVLRGTPPDVPFLVHLGEGTDAQSAQEIFELDRMGALDSRTVIVHGVGLSPAGRALLEQRGGALVWCPTSNLFTLGTTLTRDTLARHRRVALGSDSALTAEGDLLDEIRAAYRLSGGDGEWVYQLVSNNPAEILHLTRGEGALQPASVADLVAIPDTDETPAAALVKATFREIELVLLAGQPCLLSSRLAQRWPNGSIQNLGALRIDGVERLVRAPLPWLFEETEKHIVHDIRLVGRQVKR